MTVTKILGEQSGIQYQGVKDKSEADPRDALINALFTGQFKRGPFNKLFKVTKANIRAKLGFDPDNLQYQAIEDILKEGVPFVWVMRVKSEAEFELICAEYLNTSNTFFYVTPTSSSANYEEFATKFMQTAQVYVSINGEYTLVDENLGVVMISSNDLNQQLEINLSLGSLQFSGIKICSAVPIIIDTLN